MDIKDFLAADNVLVDVRVTDKAMLLRELAGRAAKALGLSADGIVGEIEKRDALGSTGIGRGVSIPHARLREVKAPFGLLARLKAPIEFASIDGQPVDLAFLLLLPEQSPADQVNPVAAVARRLRDVGVLAELRAAPDAAALYRAMTGHGASG